MEKERWLNLLADLDLKHAIVQRSTTIPATAENGTLYFGELDGSISCNFGNGMKSFGSTNVTPINNLTSDDTDKPLSAAQGKVLKTIIDTTNNSITTITNNISEVSEWVMIS